MIFKKNLVQYCGKDIPSDLAGSIPVRLKHRFHQPGAAGAAAWGVRAGMPGG